MITLKQILSYGAVSMLKHGPPDNLADAEEYVKQGDEIQQENAQTILKALTFLEVVIVATPDEGSAIVDHLNEFLERHR